MEVEVIGYEGYERELAGKLQKGNLTWRDGWTLNYMSRNSGWNIEDIIADLTESMGLMDYARLSKYYYSLSITHKKHENMIEAGLRLWGAITAILKYYMLSSKNININPAELTYNKNIIILESMLDNETLKELYQKGLDIIHGIDEFEGYNLEWYEEAVQLLEKAYRELNV